MPRIEFEGQSYYVPGVYSATKVANSLPGPLPQFHIPVLMGFAPDGHPYDADAKLVTGESEFTPFKLCRTDGACGEWYGRESELHRGMRMAKRHALPFAYCVNLSPLTRFSIVAETGASVAQFTLYARKFGPIAGHMKIAWTGTTTNIFTTTPVKRYAMLAANATNTAIRLYLTGKHDWLTIGSTVVIGSNAVDDVEKTITNVGEEITASGQKAYWIEVDTTVASALNTSDYAVVLQLDTDKVETSPALATCQALIDWLNQFSRYWRAVVHANFSNADPADLASDPAKEHGATWGAVTNGTAPAVTSADIDAFVARMNAGAWGEFAIREQVLPQAYCLLSSDSTSHSKMRDYATAERTRGYPISVTTGCAWGDVVIDAGDTTDPTFRSAALNSQDVMLCAGGLDREAAYLSLAPAVWARRVAGGVGHNLTNDELIFSEREVDWNEIDDGELSQLLKKGVNTYKLSIGQTYRYRVAQGLSTLQANNGSIWNSEDATTWSTMQRDLGDFVPRVIEADFEEGIVGASRVDANAIAVLLRRRAEKSLVARGFAKELVITSIALNASGNGYDVAYTVRLPDTVDFITFTQTILVGEA